MSRILRTVTTVAAVAGCQLVNILTTAPRPATSSSCLQWASDVADQAYRVVAPPPEPTAESGYYDVRVKHDVALPVQTPTANANDQAVDPVNAGSQVSAVNDGAGSGLHAGMTEAEYQRARMSSQPDYSMVGGY